MIPGRKIGATEEVFTDWFARGGDNIIVRAQAIDRSETGTLGVNIVLYTKNQEDTGEGGLVKADGGGDVTFSLGSSSLAVQQLIYQSSTTTQTSPPQGLKELVRYKISATGGSAGDGKWVSIRLFPPIFFDAGK